MAATYFTFNDPQGMFTERKSKILLVRQEEVKDFA